MSNLLLGSLSFFFSWHWFRSSNLLFDLHHFFILIPLTWFISAVGGNCGYGPNVPANDMVVALPNHLYYSNAGCGSCYEVKCVAPTTLPNILGGVDGNACKTDKSIIVYGSDRCPVSTLIQLERYWFE